MTKLCREKLSIEIAQEILEEFFVPAYDSIHLINSQLTPFDIRSSDWETESNSTGTQLKKTLEFLNTTTGEKLNGHLTIQFSNCHTVQQAISHFGNTLKWLTMHEINLVNTRTFYRMLSNANQKNSLHTNKATKV